MKFINTGNELLSADCIESIEFVKTGNVYSIRIITISDKDYQYNPDKIGFMNAETAAALMERLVKEIQEE